MKNTTQVVSLLCSEPSMLPSHSELKPKYRLCSPVSCVICFSISLPLLIHFRRRGPLDVTLAPWGLASVIPSAWMLFSHVSAGLTPSPCPLLCSSVSSSPMHPNNIPTSPLPSLDFPFRPCHLPTYYVFICLFTLILPPSQGMAGISLAPCCVFITFNNAWQKTTLNNIC